MNKLLPPILILFAAPSFGEVYSYNSGHNLLEKCNEYEKTLGGDKNRKKLTPEDVNALGKINFCAGYVSGVIDQLIDDDLLCIDGITFKEMLLAVNTHLKNNPNELKNHRYSLTRKALIGKFPCN